MDDDALTNEMLGQVRAGADGEVRHQLAAHLSRVAAKAEGVRLCPRRQPMRATLAASQLLPARETG